MPEQHAFLGASSAHRWLNCPPSARTCQNFPGTKSEYAAAGTLAHSIAELKARNYFLGGMTLKEFKRQLKELKAQPEYDKGMDAATDMYLDHLREVSLEFQSPPFVALETKVVYSHIAPAGFGTADCIMVGSGRLCVVDYKNGAGVAVDAEDNPQMMLYALGALHTYDAVYGDSIERVRMDIVQPNAGGIKTWETSVAELNRWGTEYAAPRAQLAWEGKGEYAAGEWCRFCAAKAQCRARAEQYLALEQEKKEPALLTFSEIGDILSRAQSLASWVKQLEEFALHMTLEGNSISGWKAVEGRGSREWIDGTDAAFEKLVARGVPNALLWEQKPVTVAALEKALGKKAFAESAKDLVLTKPGKPTLVPESDKRPAYNPAALAFTPVEE